ncbi:unnamed protein product, partial [Rotaria sp. Silwood2]
MTIKATKSVSEHHATTLSNEYNHSNDNEQQQQQHLAHVLEIVQDLKALSILLAVESITFILDLVCLAS